LIDIREPEESYSAGAFVRDANAQIAEILSAGKIPLLVGGTMLYFRALTEGIAELPAADPDARRQIDAEALERGWPALHARLERVDPVTAARLSPNDSQRIQRALEVYAATGQPISAWQRAAGGAEHDRGVRFLKIGLWPEPRSVLHRRIEERLDGMLDQGLLDEVRALMDRPRLDRDMPSMRAVGYRQIWAYLAGECSLEEGRYRALVATRQLAKRQFTWLRSEREIMIVDPLETDCIGPISRFLASHGLIPG
jgi:tRNA dimethylallyltransferase